MRSMSSVDIRNIDIYEDESLGPPPRFLVEARRNDERPNVESDMQDRNGVSPLARLKSVLATLRFSQARL